MKLIKLTKGLFTVVDNSDYEMLSKFKWCASHNGTNVYAVRGIKLPNGKWSRIYLHRQLMNAVPKTMLDHRDGDSLNNRRGNLRFCTSTGNGCNKKSYTGRSKFKGVSWHEIGNKWQAHIQSRGLKHYLGLFADEKGAALAYDVSAIKLHGEFARLNFPTLRREP